MKIIIPLGGKDSEFRSEFGCIKPLTLLGGHRMIEIFLKKFQFKNEIIFLCTKDDLINTNLLSVLQNLKQKKKIIPIGNNTTSVIETVNYAEKLIDDDESVLICHPDSINNFNSIANVKNKLLKTKLDGYMFAFDEDCPTNTIETQTGRVQLKNNKIIKINEKSIKTIDSLRFNYLVY